MSSLGLLINRCMNCAECDKELQGKDQLTYCSLSCSTTHYAKNRKEVECPECNKILRSRWKYHISKCEGIKTPVERPKSRCSACDKELPNRRRKTCDDKCHRLAISNTMLNRPVTEKMREAGRNAAKRNGSGYKRGSGRGKSGWYKDIWCDSSWELAVLMYHLDNDIPIERNTKQFEYKFDGKTFKYIPDFIVGNTLIEVKGYWSEQNLEKIKQCPENVRIIDKKNISKYLTYAKNTYGAKFIELYESRVQEHG